MSNTVIPCYDCDGKGIKWESSWKMRPCPPGGDYTQMSKYRCGTCNGFKVLVATELRAVVKAEVKHDVA